jgi:hypothetical protein
MVLFSLLLLSLSSHEKMEAEGLSTAARPADSKQSQAIIAGEAIASPDITGVVIEE